MIVEIATILLWLVSGALVLAWQGIRGWVLIPFGYLVGIALYLGLGVLVFAASPPYPLHVIAGLLGVGCLGLARQVRLRLSVPIVTATMLGLVGSVWLLRRAALANYHWDSLEHAAIGSMLFDGRFVGEGIDLLQLRGIGVGLLHAPANVLGDLYLPAVSPLMAVAVLGVVVWLLTDGSSSGRLDRLVAVLAVAALVSVNRFVYHAFYLNGHLLVAALLLIVVGCGWRMSAPAPGAPRSGLLVAQLACLPALVVTRPEMLVLAGLAMFPTLVNASIALRHRIRAVIVWGGSAVIYYGSLIAIDFRAERVVSFNSVVFLVIGFVILTVVSGWLVLVDRWRLSHFMSRLGEGAVWLALVTAAVAAPELMWRSLQATWVNVAGGGGGWGASLVLLGALAVALGTIKPGRSRWALRFPLTASLPAFFVLAFGRGGAFRVSEADSLNRMLIHLLPLLVVYLADAIRDQAAQVTLDGQLSPRAAVPPDSPDAVRNSTR